MLNIPTRMPIQRTSILFIVIVALSLMTFISTNFDLFQTHINPPFQLSPLFIEPQANLVNLGVYLFTQIPLAFLLVGIILFISILGAITLTHSHLATRRQNILTQVFEDRDLVILR